MKNNISIVDTNFILRYLLADIKEQYSIADDFFQKVRTNKIKTIIKEVVFTEVIYVLSSHYKVSRNRIVKVLSNFLRYKGIIMEDKEAIFEALNIYENSNLHIVDSILAAYAKLNHYSLMTFDGELNKYIFNDK